MRTISLLFFTTSFLAFTAQAEYRVFTLNLENTKTKAVRQIQSTLDPEQYASIYPLNKDEKLTYVQTWRCRGRTDFFKPHCAPPTKPTATAPTKAQN